MFDLLDERPRNDISPEELEKLQERITVFQEQGLRFAERYLIQRVSTDANSYEKAVTSTDDPVGYDFAITDQTGMHYICVKPTEGGFDKPMHVSYNELSKMRETSERYDLYRVYEIGEATAYMRIAENVAEFAAEILKILETLPEGVKPDGVSVNPLILNFQNPIKIELSAPDE